ncbi:arabinosyl transferase C [Corynebacterium resistens DSM 45100]|uniref:Arabinosyl transferase C n=1 Tax=Corynebacterium resistens (strain DSM 45100 / JCM 12819 / GTC 2026 / SICGH 158) TaxID=662755 RepID=F8DYG1_CORRG|nr:arabinosyltransferase domain-containing protein [Corynebacterium resistens]AEI08854.1 arabinosyl transferase C [Corynebacterium resistens DSM 45100]
MSHVQQQRQAKSTVRQRSRLKLVSIVSGLVGLLLFLSLPFLPVKQESAEFNWPQGGDLRSVTAPLISYVPQDLDITLPLQEAQNLNKGETSVLSTVPENSTEPTLRGMFVRSTGDGLDVVLRNVVPLSLSKDELKQLPKDAKLRITSNSEVTRVWVPDATRKDGTPMDASIADDIRPMVTGIYSEITNNPESAKKATDAGLHAHVTVDSRFSSSPTFLKSAAMWLGVILTIVALWALHQMDKLDGRGQSSRRGRMLPAGWWRPRLLDGVVGGALLVWFFVGANTADDGYILTMSRISEHAGYMANYYRWFGVPESPFGSPFYDLITLMTKVSSSSIWVRLPSLLAGLVTWLVLSREVLPRLGAKVNRRAVAHWTMAAVFLLFWMTYNNGTRPEPIIAMLSLLTWVSLERAIATHRLLPAAVGTLFATLAISAGPTGLMAVAALLASISSLIGILIRRLPLLDAPKGSPRGRTIVAVLAQLVPFLPAGTAVLVAVFADQTLASVMEAIRVRSAIGPAVPWYEEYLRYTALLEQTVDGSFPRRFSILILFFAFGVVIASMLRNRRVPGAAKGPSMRLVMIMLGTMFFMTFTPTKWTHHFGVYAGIGAAVAALAAIAASHIALKSLRNRILFIGATLMLFAFTLSGTNGWWYISSYGVPWWDKSIQIAGIEMSSVMLVFALLVLVTGVIIGFLSDAKHARATSSAEVADIDRKESRQTRRLDGLTAAPIGVLSAVVVTFIVASLTKGMLSQWPAYSVGQGNIKTLSGTTCQLADAVRVESNTNDSFLEVADGSALKDSLKDSNSRGFDPNNVPTRINPGENNTSGTTPQTSVVNQNQYKSGNSSTDGSASNKTNDGTDKSDNQDGNGSKSDSQGQSASDAANAAQDQSVESGTTGGLTETKGVNGSYAKLPFGLDGKKVPVLGSFTEGLQLPAHTTTKWFKIPELSEKKPLIVFSAAGEVAHYDMNGVFQYGQELKVEFGRSNGKGEFELMGEYQPLDIGTAPEWRNMRIPKEAVPEGADVIRIRAVDMNVTPDQWLAITPPRAPELVSMNEAIGSDQPGLLDWSVALQFPCQRSYDHNAGVAEVPTFRVSPDHSGRRAHTPVMDYAGGGSVGLVQMTTEAQEMPTYLQDDWQRDWGVLDKLTTYQDGAGEEPKQVVLEKSTETRSGTWTPGPMKFEAKKSKKK